MIKLNKNAIMPDRSSSPLLGLWVTWATLFTLARLIPYSHSLDLVSSILSKTPNLSEKLPLPNLKSLMGSSEAVQKLLQNRGLLPFISAEAAAAADPVELNKLISKLKPKQGRFDPAVLDMLSTFDNNYSGNIPSIFGNSHESPLLLGGSSSSDSDSNPSVISRRQPTSTEENGIIWSSTAKPLPIVTRKILPYVRNRFSSKFRNNMDNNNNNKPDSSGSNANISTNTESPLMQPESNQSLTTTEPNGGFIPSMPFNHITDPNIRNHRLYEWEFETYKNFTHIDQDEDLMADESEPSVVIVKPTSSSEIPKYVTSTIIPTGWIPQPGTSRPRGPSIPDYDENVSSDSNSPMINDLAPGTFVKFPEDSDEPNKPPRIREPLRESSTENLIFTHSSGEDRDRERDRDRDLERERNRERDRYRYKYRDRDRLEDNRSDGRVTDDKFSASQPEPELSPPVFVDPDQDFFTSTIRNSDEKTSDEYLNSLPGFRPPRRRHRKKPTRDEGQGQEGSSSSTSGSSGGYRDRYEMTSSTSSSNVIPNKKKFYSDEEEYYKKMERERLERNRDEIAKDKPNRDRDVVMGGSSQSEEHIRNSDRERERERDEERERDRERDRDRDRPLRPIHDDRDHLAEDDDRNVNRDRHRDRPSDYNTNRPANSQETIPYTRHKSDRILNQPQYPDDESKDYHRHNSYPSQHAQSSENRPFYHPSLPYTFGQGSNELGLNRGDLEYNSPGYNPEFHNSYPSYGQGSTEGGHSNSPSHPGTDHQHQIYAGDYANQYPHPFGGEQEIMDYSHDDSSSWSNTYFILGGLIALSALVAFLLPTLLSSMGRNGKNRDDLSDDDVQNEYIDENTSTSDTNTAASTTPEGDPSDSDLWTEIKGVYNDVVNIVRGDYGGIVDKLTGGSGISTGNISNTKKNTKKDTDGPNIVYRDEEDENLDDEEDDEKSEEIDVGKVHRKNMQKKLKKILSNRNKNNDRNTIDITLRDRKGPTDENTTLRSKSTSSSSSSTTSVKYDEDTGGSDNEPDSDNETSNNNNDNNNRNKDRKNNSKNIVITPTKDKKRNTKNRTISSSINYIVKNNGRPVETSRGAPTIIHRNETMAGFHLGGNHNNYRYYNNGSIIPNSNNMATSTEGFLGEWAKVQLIGN